MAVNKRINKNGTISFVADWRDKAGKRYEKTFKTEAEAIDHEKIALAEIVKGEFIAPAKETVRELCEQWLQLKRTGGYKRGTMIDWEGHVNNHILPELADLKIAEANDYTALINAGLHWKEASSARTACKIMTTVASIFELALQQRKIRENIARRKNVRPRIPADERKNRAIKTSEVYNREEIRRIIAATESGTMERLLVMLLAMTGMRIGEILGLTWKYVDLETGTIEVAQTLDEPRRLGETFILQPAKTINSERVFERLPTALIHELKIWKLKCPISKEKFVFCNVEGKPYFHKYTWTLLRRIIKAAGLTLRLSHHGFRHTFASLMFDSGVKDIHVARLMGHANSMITRSIYTHFINDDKSTALADLGESLVSTEAK